MISFVFSVIQLFFQIKVLIILPRALGLRHAQVIGRQGRRVTVVARKHAVHRAERSAARPLLPQLLDFTAARFPDYRHNPYLKGYPARKKLVLSLLGKKQYRAVHMLFAAAGH